MRPIDADALIHHFYETEYASMYYIEVVKRIIDAQPTLSTDEVRGVVKCKDCTFGESATDGDGNPCVLCGNSMVFDYPYAHDPDWFCADGEMKGAEDGTTDNS